MSQLPMLASDMRGDSEQSYVTFRLHDQWFALPVAQTQDILRAPRLTSVPLAPEGVMGCINMRGRVATVIDLAQWLHINTAPCVSVRLCIVVEYQKELFALAVDEVSEVMTIATNHIEALPATLAAEWKELAQGIYPVADRLLVLLDIQQLTGGYT